MCKTFSIQISTWILKTVQRVRTAIHTGSAGLEAQREKVAFSGSSSHHLGVTRRPQPSVRELSITTEGSFLHKQALLGGMCHVQCQCREVCGLVSRTTEPCILRGNSEILEEAYFFRVFLISSKFIPETEVLCININTYAASSQCLIDKHNCPPIRLHKCQLWAASRRVRVSDLKADT